MHPSMLQFPNHLVWCCSFLFPPEMSGIFRGLFPTHQPSLGSFFSCSILASRPSAKGETTARQECTSFDLFPLAIYFPLPITMSHLMLIMMSYFAVERYTSVKWNERFDMGFWHGTLWRFEKLCFLSCRKRPGCCGPPLWQVIMEFGRFLTKNQFYLWSFLSGPFVVTLQCFSCTIPSSLLLCIQAFL